VFQKVGLAGGPVKIQILLSLVGALLTFQLNASSVQGAKDEKIRPDELIARHLASIGSAEAIAAARSRTISGEVVLTFHLGDHGKLHGTASIFSEKEKARINMIFNSIQYPGDQLAYDGKAVTASYVRPGLRSQLSRFIYAHAFLLREGLIGGTTTTAWALLNAAERQPKLKYTGLKNVEGRRRHELSYRAKRGAGDLQVWLYFDPETFRHTCSLYKLVRTANMATEITESPYQRDSIYKILEEFEDFREVDGLTLPYRYKLTFSVEGEPTVLHDWVISVDEVRHNAPLQPGTFVAR
jgi:hypothetical protein